MLYKFLDKLKYHDIQSLRYIRFFITKGSHKINNVRKKNVLQFLLQNDRSIMGYIGVKGNTEIIDYFSDYGSIRLMAEGIFFTKDISLILRYIKKYPHDYENYINFRLIISTDLRIVKSYKKSIENFQEEYTPVMIDISLPVLKYAMKLPNTIKLYLNVNNSFSYDIPDYMLKINKSFDGMKLSHWKNTNSRNYNGYRASNAMSNYIASKDADNESDNFDHNRGLEDEIIEYNNDDL